MSGFFRSMIKQAGQVREQRRAVTVVSDAAQTVTGAMMASGTLVCPASTGRAFTMDTAANLIASSSLADMDIGDVFEFTVVSTGAGAVTVGVATGVTNAGAAGALVVAAATSRRFLLTKTSSTAMTIMGL